MNTWIFNKVEFEADKKNDGLRPRHGQVIEILHMIW